jgi:hypothetical protein
VQGDATFHGADGSTALVRRGALYRSGGGAWLATAAGQVELGLSDGTATYLGPQTDLVLTQVADPTLGVTATTLTLNRGLALAVLALGPGERFAILAPTGVEAGAEAGTLGVVFDPATGRLEADCLAGECLLSRGQASLALQAGQRGWFEGTEGPFGPESAQTDHWAYSGVALPASTPTEAPLPSLTPSPSPTPRATRTRPPTRTPAPSATPTQPTPTPTRRPATVAPLFTATPVPPTAVPPTAVPPTNPPPTAVPPTAVPPTAVPPTPTLVIVPTPTPPPSDTPVPPTEPPPSPTP